MTGIGHLGWHLKIINICLWLLLTEEEISTSGQYGSSLPSDFDKRSQICISLARRKWYVPINHVTFNVRTVCLNGIPGN
ncbi:hypothetical protein WN943_000979 [Citrus x changshan-huyou]